MTPVCVEEKTLVSKAASGAQKFKETKPILKKIKCFRSLLQKLLHLLVKHN